MQQASDTMFLSSRSLPIFRNPENRKSRQTATLVLWVKQIGKLKQSPIDLFKLLHSGKKDTATQSDPNYPMGFVKVLSPAGDCPS